MAENGTVFTGRELVGKWEFVRDKNHVHSPIVAVQTGLGKVVASVCGDAGIYDELCIELVRDDGRTLQLAVIGVTEKDNEYEDDDTGLHAYVYDGISSDGPTWDHDIAVSDNGAWY